MKLKSLSMLAAVVIALLASVSVSFASDVAADGGPAFQTLDRIETIVYGSPQGGGLLARLNTAEKDVFGRELPGSLTERQTAMLDFMEKGTTTQPSLLFKLSVAEWAVAQQIHPEWSLARRVDTLEAVVEGTVQGGALASRIERLITKLLPEGVLATPVEIPAATVVKTSLTQTLTVKNVKVDDKVVLKLLEEIVVSQNLVAPRGSRVFAHITKVKPPRSFGRPSEIEMAFDALEVIGPNAVTVAMGEAAKKAMEADAATIGAVGASFAGAILLGPLGLASGFLVRGSDNQLKEGTLFYVETTAASTVHGYKIPNQISSIVISGDVTTPQGAGSQISQ
ncbi:MAG: hypothetical protein PHO18_06745 [Synergistaceae bacterium]|nr:hypothetical protein [Synergistaceae bacterium]